MPLYQYKAFSQSGDLILGEMEESSQEVVIQKVRELGYFPVRAEETGRTSRLQRLFTQDLTRRRGVGRAQLVLITREFATLLEAGIPLDRALDIVIGMSSQKGPRDVLENIRNSVHGGASVAEAMGMQPKVFPAFYVNMVRAGEASGQLQGVLTRLADLLERAQAISENVKSSLIYPIILLLMAALSLTFLLTIVLPEFQPLFAEAGKKLPLATRIVMGASQAVQEYWWAGLIGIGAVWLAFKHDRGSPAGRYRWDAVLLRLPILGALVLRLAFARFSRMLGTLLANGVGLLTAVSLARDTLGNVALTQAVDRVSMRIKEGGGFAEPLAATGIFPPLAVDLIRVGEESGQLENMLLKAADIYDREAQRTVDRALALLVPLLTIGLGALIAAIIASVLVAIYSVNDLAF